MNKNKLLIFVIPALFLLMLCTPTENASAVENPSTDFTYTKTSTEVTITSYKGTRKNLEIPATIDGLPVTTVGVPGTGKLSSSLLTSIVIPEGVISIEESSFVGQYNLTSLTLPSTLKSIGKNAFTSLGGSASGLSILELPEGLIEIGERAFQGARITNITIPSTVKTIGSEAFSNTKALNTVTLKDGVPYISESMFFGSTLNNINLPNSITGIGDNAFKQTTNLKSITIPNGVTLGNSSFMSSESLESVILPDDLVDLPYGVFSRVKLSSLTLPNTLRTIGGNAFSHSLLTELTIPEGVTSIGDGAFGYNKLTKVYLPTTINTVGVTAFMNNQTDNSNLTLYGWDSATAVKGNADLRGYTYVSLDGTIPPVTGGNGGTGSIIKDAEVDINAGELKLTVPNVVPFPTSNLQGTSFDILTKLDSNIEVSDSRGSAEGWRLTLTTSGFKTTINGSEYTLPSGILSIKKPRSISSSVSGSNQGLNILMTNEFTNVDGLGSIPIANAEVGFGKGITDIAFDTDNVLKLNINPDTVLVDKVSKQSKYVATMTWSLTEAP